MKEHILDIYRDKKLTAKFCVIGAIGFLCNYGVLKLCISAFDLNRIVAEVIAVIVALHLTFFLHNQWTYKIDQTTHKYKRSIASRYKLYFASNSFGALLTVVFFAIFSMSLSHLPALALAALIGLAWNFFVNKIIVWKHHPSK